MSVFSYVPLRDEPLLVEGRVLQLLLTAHVTAAVYVDLRLTSERDLPLGDKGRGLYAVCCSRQYYAPEPILPFTPQELVGINRMGALLHARPRGQLVAPTVRAANRALRELSAREPDWLRQALADAWRCRASFLEAQAEAARARADAYAPQAVRA